MTLTLQILLVQQMANELASKEQQMVGPPHLLAAILASPESGGYKLLDQFSDVVELDSEIQTLIGQQTHVELSKEHQYPPKLKLPLTRHAKDAMEAAHREVLQRDMRYDTVDIITGIVRAANSDAAAVLAKHGVDATRLEQCLTPAVRAALLNDELSHTLP